MPTTPSSCADNNDYNDNVPPYTPSAQDHSDRRHYNSDSQYRVIHNADMNVLVSRVNLVGNYHVGMSVQPATPDRHLPPWDLHQDSQGDIYEYNGNPLPYPGRIATWRITTPPLLLPNDENNSCIASPTTLSPANTAVTTLPAYLPDNLEKYWRQRHMLFAKFDAGIRLDDQGWYSVTPEAVAHHVSRRLSQLQPLSQQTITILDAFGGCGGNAIAFAQLPNVHVVAIDLDRQKLRNAAHNASIYNIPHHKLTLIECNALFVLEYCYCNGEFTLDKPLATPAQTEALLAHMPPSVEFEVYEGYSIGGIDMLPHNIDVVFLDPPWGGVDYEVFGKHGYDLVKNMRISKPRRNNAIVNPAPTTGISSGKGLDDFFDNFSVQPRNKLERQAQFNATLDEEECANGAELLALAAAATRKHYVIYDVPRNTSKSSLGLAALEAGYRGLVHWEEHFWQGRCKTVSCYLGFDWKNVEGCQDTTATDPFSSAPTPEQMQHFHNLLHPGIPPPPNLFPPLQRYPSTPQPLQSAPHSSPLLLQEQEAMFDIIRNPTPSKQGHGATDFYQTSFSPPPPPPAMTGAADSHLFPPPHVMQQLFQQQQQQQQQHQYHDTNRMSHSPALQSFHSHSQNYQPPQTTPDSTPHLLSYSSVVSMPRSGFDRQQRSITDSHIALSDDFARAVSMSEETTPASKGSTRKHAEKK